MLRTRLIAGLMSGLVLSAVFATLLTLVAYGETFFEPLRVDPGTPAPITLRLPRTALRVFDAESSSTRSDLPQVVPRGSVVRDRHLAHHVRTYERERRPPRLTHLGAYFLVCFLVTVMMTTYLRRGSTRQGTLLRTQVGLIVLAACFLVANKGYLLLTGLPPFLAPVAIVPLLSSYFLDRRSGMLMGAVITLHAASFVTYDPIVCATYFASCAFAAVTLRGRTQGPSTLVAGVAGGLCAALVYVAAKETLDGFELAAELAPRPLPPLACIALAGLASGVLAMLLRPLVARVLGVLSRGQLMNLADVDQPLLRKMAAEAPGSWEHSRAMANLAEAAAAAIHADALLTRVGAYYHDLGKTCQHKYYVENLAPGEPSPHEPLDPDVSADAIMAHVIEGVRILREGSVPEPVIEFAYTHHGTSLIEYFWHKCLQQGNPKGLQEEAFRYPGMRPRTKETAILMLIDSIEAGARTVDPPTHQGFEELVRRVIFSKLKQGQLDDSTLTLQDLHVLASRITDTLVSVYHGRIRYPWQDERESSRGAEPAPSEAEAAEAGVADPAGRSPTDTRLH